MISKLRMLGTIVSRSERRWLTLYLVVAILASLLEVGGIGLVFAFFQAAMDAEKLAHIPHLTEIRRMFGLSSETDFLSALSLFVFLTFLARTLVLFAAAWLNLSLRRRINERLSDELFRGYVRQPYLWHLQSQPERLYQNVANNTGNVTQNCVLGTVDIVGAAALLLFFGLTLALLRPYVTMVAVVAVGTLAVINTLVVRKRVSRWGRESVVAQEDVVRVASESLRGIKTIKVANLGTSFANLLNEAQRRYLGSLMNQGLVQQAPRLIIELVLVSGLLGGVVAALAGGHTATDIIPTLALFGAAAFRLVPALVRILNASQFFRFTQPALDVLVTDLTAIRSQKDEKATWNAAAPVEHFTRLTLKDASFRYPAATAVSIEQMSFELKHGELIALAGPSGSGKTTLVDLLLGLLPPLKGQVMIDGHPMTAPPQGFFAYVPQDPFVVHDTLARNIALGRPDATIDRERMAEVIDAAALSSVVARLPQGIDTELSGGSGSLSGGERQRLGLARALYANPQVLVLDEPTSALDPETEAAVVGALLAMRGKKAVIVIAHRLMSVRNFDKIVFLERGQITGQGSFDRLYRDHSRFQTMVDLLASTNAGASEPMAAAVEKA